jgi:ribosomal protein S6
MLRYETLFITVPEITSDEAGKLEKTLEKSVSQEKGSVISFERWGKYHLAYPIRTYDYGVYYLMRFEVADERKTALLEDLKTLFSVKFGDLIMRNILVRLDPRESLEYKRPESLEEAPSKDIDVIMKESKSILGPRRDRGSQGPQFASDKPEPLFETEMNEDEDFNDGVIKTRG